MANDIPKRQNEERSLSQLAAQRHLYSCAKRVGLVQFVAAICLPAVLLLVEFYWPDATVWVALFGLVLTVLDEAILNSWKESLRERAAVIQESFDSYVLDIPWSDLFAGPPPNRDDFFTPGAAAVSRSALRDWYSPVVGEVPPDTARLICQRSSCAWDSRQRRRFRIIVLVVVSIVVVAMISFGLLKHLSLADFVLSVLAPVMPFLMWSVREVRDHSEAATRVDDLRTYNDELWNRILKGEMLASEMQLESRRLQDAIFEHRRHSPMVPDWVHSSLKSTLEKQMKASVRDMVGELKTAGQD